MEKWTDRKLKLVEEFPKVPKDRIELIANRIYDQMYEDKDV